jgi:hypothetical protein
VSAAAHLHIRTARARTGGLSLVLALGAITLAGCGSSTHRSAADPVRPVVHGGSTAADPASPPPSGPATAAGPTSTGGGASVAAVCHALSINLNALGRIADSPDNPDAKQSIVQLRHLADVAPSAIKHDLQVIADFDEKLLDDVRAGKSVDSVQETPELTAAQAHEARWIRANCL